MKLKDDIFELCSHPENSEEFDFSVDCKEDRLAKSNKRAQEYMHKIENLQCPVNADTFKRMAELIKNAKCPIFYIGQGAENATDLLSEAAIKARVPVTTTLHAMGLVCSLYYYYYYDML